MTEKYDKEDLYMKINGSRRNINYIEPDKLTQTGFASVKITPPVIDICTYQRINVDGLEKMMKSVGLDYVREFYGVFGPSWGFNDISMMGKDNVKLAEERGQNHMVVGVTPNLTAAMVTVHGNTFNPSEMELFGYMNLLLDRFVGFVEDSHNYNQKLK